MNQLPNINKIYGVSQRFTTSREHLSCIFVAHKLRNFLAKLTVKLINKKHKILCVYAKQKLVFNSPSLSLSLVQVTLLINNAGVVSGLHLLDTPDHLIERSFNVNVMAHFWVC